MTIGLCLPCPAAPCRALRHSAPVGADAWDIAPVPTATCQHGLVQRVRFGIDQRNGLEICRGCGLPTFESVFANAKPAAGASQSPEARDLWERLEQQMTRSNEILDGIRVGVFLIFGFLVIVFVSGLLGLWHLTITP